MYIYLYMYIMYVIIFCVYIYVLLNGGFLLKPQIVREIHHLLWFPSELSLHLVRGFPLPRLNTGGSYGGDGQPSGNRMGAL